MSNSHYYQRTQGKEQCLKHQRPHLWASTYGRVQKNNFKGTSHTCPKNLLITSKNDHILFGNLSRKMLCFLEGVANIVSGVHLRTLEKQQPPYLESNMVIVCGSLLFQDLNKQMSLTEFCSLEILKEESDL